LEIEMSLTKAEWEAMWDAIKKIENYINFNSQSERKKNVKVYTEYIKEKIQQVIGQME